MLFIIFRLLTILSIVICQAQVREVLKDGFYGNRWTNEGNFLKRINWLLIQIDSGGVANSLLNIGFEFIKTLVEELVGNLYGLLLVEGKDINIFKIHFIFIIFSLHPIPMSMLNDFNYSECHFEARLQKPNMLRFRKKQQFYLYVSKDFMIINKEPYSKKPEIILKLLPTTHVKWLWEYKRGMKNQLKGFIIETEGYMNEFVAEKVVLQTLKIKFKEITLQSDFYDEYILGEYIDKGNYAQVYQCIRKDKHEKFAVKILQKQRLKNMKNGKESVFNELKILRHLRHENLMRLFEVYEDRNKYYFVLELLEGTTLYKEIQNRKKKQEMKSHQIRSILRQILQGLKFLHSENIMHRDIKPENILFQSKSSLDDGDGGKGLKLVDYGLATFQHEKHIIFTKCGTPGFVAPQVINYDQRQAIYSVNVDTFSVGVILHVLLVGEQPFAGRSRNTILNKNKQCRLDFKSKKYEAIATDGIDILMKMLEKSPQKRMTAEEALNHPFLTTDKPIFKFKKITKSQPEMVKNVTMRMVHNFEEIEEESGFSPMKSMKGNAQNQNNDTFFSPFCYDDEKIDPLLLNMSQAENPSKKRKVVRQIGPKQLTSTDNYFTYSV